MKKKIIGLLILVMLFAMFGDIRVARAGDEYIDIEFGKKYSGYGKFRFSLDEPSKVTVEGTDRSNDATLWRINEVTGRSEAMVVIAEKGNTFTLAKGTYYIEARSSITVTYTIPNPDIEGIESDTFDEAQEITMGIKYSGDFNATWDIDYYKFILDAPGSVYAEAWSEKIGTESSIKKAELYWEDEDLNTHCIAEFDTFTGYGRSNRYRLPAGVYYLVLTHHNSHYYNFKVNYEAESPEEYETEDYTLEDGYEHVNAISTNREYTGNIQKSKDVDFYGFEVEDSSRIQLKFTQPRGTEKGIFSVILYKEENDGKITTLDEIVTTENPVYRGKELILSDGEYYIQIRRNPKYYRGEDGIKSDELSFIDYKISVIEEPIKIVKDITLKTSKKSFYSGMTFSLKATLIPKNPTDASVTWSSSDKDIATVDKNGKVTCLRPGKCYIYAKANDGGGAVGKYLLTVTKSPIKTLSKVTVSDGTISPEFDKTIASYTITLPKNISKVTIKWSRSS
ncbi:MAG: Ig-like domain-containing protein, partial [Lachnospiraceae bacterium]|nr:Ig-like domain-containing protein [Lachnospiraceae bacterium]